MADMTYGAQPVYEVNGGGNDGFANSWIWVFFLFFLLAWGGNGLGFGNSAAQGSLTRAELAEGFNFQDINGQLRGITNGICDGFYAQNSSLKDGFNAIQKDLCQGFNGIGSQIAENRYAAQNCCCETNRNIDAVRYENSKNTCDIVTAIRADGDATRALITQNSMQELRDKLADRDRELQTANFQLSQQVQNATLISTLRPFPQPAYVTCSPYTADTCYCNGCN